MAPLVFLANLAYVAIVSRGLAVMPGVAEAVCYTLLYICTRV